MFSESDRKRIFNSLGQGTRDRIIERLEGDVGYGGRDRYYIQSLRPINRNRGDGHGHVGAGEQGEGEGDGEVEVYLESEDCNPRTLRDLSDHLGMKEELLKIYLQAHGCKWTEGFNQEQWDEAVRKVSG